jgi:hypothetical protein
VNDVQLAYDECAGRWLLLNRTAREAVLLPGTDSDGLGYVLAWDDEGYGQVGDEAGRSSDVDDLLREHVYQDAAGLLYVAVTDPVGELVVTRLTEAELQYEYALLRMKLVLGCQALSLHIAVFQRRGEDGARLFFDANELYRSLGLDAHGGKPWKWVNSNLPLWQRLHQEGLGVVKRGAVVAGDPGRQDPSRTLAHTSVSLPMCLVILSRLAQATRAGGGCASSERRQGAL